MRKKEVKTGQSVDNVKSQVIQPVVAEYVHFLFEQYHPLSILDVGSGDATSSYSLLSFLAQQGRLLRNFAALDADLPIFPDLVETISTQLLALDTQVVHTQHGSLVNEFIDANNERFDLALCQLVLHQVEHDFQVAHLMNLVHYALNPTGDLLLVNLHSQYLEYLSHYEPDKFRITNRGARRFTGKYMFDSGGSANIYGRTTKETASILVELGFDYVSFTPIFTHAIQDQKPRYRDLVKKDIPMFSLLHMKKNPKHFLSSTKGMVREIEEHSAQWINIILLDGEEISVPKFKGWKNVQPMSYIFLHEVLRKDVGVTILSYWIMDPQDILSGGQLVLRA